MINILISEIFKIYKYVNNLDIVLKKEVTSFCI